MAETDLYRPVKQFLQAQGYTVKGEIGPCDVVAVRADEGPVVVELKERLSLSLVLQAVNRLTMSDAVYVAFRVGKGHSASWRSQGKYVVSLLRRTGPRPCTVSPATEPSRPREASEGVRRTRRRSRSRRLRRRRASHGVSSGRPSVRT